MTVQVKDRKVGELSAADILKPSIEESYKEIISEDQEQTKTRASNLPILPEEAKKNIVAAAQYSSYFPNPITKPFMRKYILAKLEFPTKGSELSQSLTELNVRIDNLFNDAYMYKKAQLEADKADIEIKILEKKLDKKLSGVKVVDGVTILNSVETDEDSEEALEAKLIENEIAMKRVEQENKLVSLNKIKLTAMARYNEAMGWKGCVEDIMNEMGKTSLDDVDFNSVRMEEMAAKIKRWGELHAQGALELTPSKLQAIDSNSEAFAAGIKEVEEVLRLQDLRKK